jgi:TP901 family phage tail tape measure protein
MGRAYVEIGADSRKFFGALSKVNGAIKNMGASIASAGAKLTAAGLSAAAPFAASIRSGAAYQDQLLGIKASTGATAEQLQAVDAAAMKMSKSMSIGPTAIAQSFLALLKAGMPLEKVLGGAGEAAIQFAKVGNLEFTQAAEVMSDAMNSFKVDASTASNVISSAADSSSTSIEQMAWSFSMASAAAGLANQNIQDTAAALAIMANNGVKGSDAGTSLKTMFLRLMAPVDETIQAMNEVGLSVDSFRNSSGKMLPLVQIIDRLNGSMGNLDQKAKDDIMRRIFGSDALRAAAILQTAGREGFTAMASSMAGAMSLGDKFGVQMSGLSGAGSKLMASLERLAIAVSNALAPSLTSAATSISDVIERYTEWVKANEGAVLIAAKFAAGAAAIGTGMVAIGGSMMIASSAVGLFLRPLGAIAGVSLGVVGALASVTSSVVTLAAAGAASAARFAASMVGTALASVLTFSSAGLSALGAYVSRQAALLALAAVAPLEAAAASTVSALAGMASAAVASVASAASVIAASVAQAAAGNMRAAAAGVTALAGMASTAVASVARSAQIIAASMAQAASAAASSLAGMAASAVSSAATAAAAMVSGAATSSAAWVAANAKAVVAFLQVRAAAAYAAVQSASSFSWLSASAISSAAASSAAWVANMGRVAASAVASGAVSMAAFAKTAAAAIAAGAVTTASLLAPFLLVGAAIAAGVAIVYAFRDSIFSAFSGTVEMAQATGNAVLATSASFAAPFLEWIGGQKMVLDAVEPWIAFIQNVITAAGTNIAIGWEHMWFGMSQTVQTIGAVMMGTIDNFVTPILNLFDEIKLAVSAVAYEIDQATTLHGPTFEKQKAEREAYVEKVRGGMEERTAKSGINARLEEAGKQKEIARGEMNARTGAMQDAADKTMGDRLQGVEDRRKEREAAAAEAAKPKAEPAPLYPPPALAAPLPPELAAASGGIAAAVDLKNQSMGSFSALSAGGQGIGSTVTIQKDQLDMLKKINTTLETLGPYVA